MWGMSNTEDVTSAGTDECLQPDVHQSCSGPAVSEAAGARAMVLCPADGCCSTGGTDACMWVAHCLIDAP